MSWARPGLVRAVAETPDLRRVRDLPRRDWPQDPRLSEVQRLLTESYRYQPDPIPGVCTPDCEGCKAQYLNPAQAQWLWDLVNQDGRVFGMQRVGSGKTLVSLLAFGVYGAKRGLLIVPAAQRPKTLKVMGEYARHWRLTGARIVTYEWLGHERQLGWLDQYQPDLVVPDEAHKLKDSSTKHTKRLGWYLRKNQAARITPLTGSPGGRNLRQYWHYMRWSLGQNAPVPHDFKQMQAWSLALDEKVPPESRYEPGALLTLAQGQGSTELERARDAYQKRLNATPGVVSTFEERPPVPLLVDCVCPELPDSLVQAILQLRKERRTPDGYDFSGPLALWQHARAMGCGLFHRPDPAPPDSWLFARRDWFSWVNEKLRFDQRGRSAVHLIKELDQHPDGAELYRRWSQLEPCFRWNSVPYWVDTTVLELAKRWIKDRPRGLVWVEHRAFGQRLAQETGLPYFCEGGLDSRGVLIDRFKGPAIASISSCREGHNLQGWWDDCLVTSPPSSGDWWEQLLGRLVRQGQTRPVKYTAVLTSRESYQSLAQAIRDAEADTKKHGQQRLLCYARKELEPVLELVRDESKELWSEVGV